MRVKRGEREFLPELNRETYLVSYYYYIPSFSYSYLVTYFFLPHPLPSLTILFLECPLNEKYPILKK